jgi:signal transduction histidine kinase
VQLIDRGGRVELTVADDGVGFVTSPSPTGLGLLGLDERVRELSGRLSITSENGRGTTLRVTMPVPVAPREETNVASAAG